MKLDAIRADLDKERNGAWVPYQGGILLKLARLGNPNYRDAIARIIDERKVQLNVKELSEEQMLDVQKEAASETVLLNWENVDDGQGKPIPYSSATALEWFRDPELWRLWNFILYESAGEEHFRKALIEDAAGN